MFIIRNGCEALCTAAAQQPFLKVRQRKEFFAILVYEGLFQLVLFFGLFVYYIPKYQVRLTINANIFSKSRGRNFTCKGKKWSHHSDFLPNHLNVNEMVMTRMKGLLVLIPLYFPHSLSQCYKNKPRETACEGKNANEKGQVRMATSVLADRNKEVGEREIFFPCVSCCSKCVQTKTVALP